MSRTRFVVALISAVALAAAVDRPAQSQDGDEEGDVPVPEISEEYLADPAHAAAGRELWDEQCVHCHGRNAYPGKAPKLTPRDYTAEFVFDRVANGYRDMPAWGDFYSEDEIKSIVAYVLSDRFSP